jgi:hypothetical protein
MAAVERYMAALRGDDVAAREKLLGADGVDLLQGLYARVSHGASDSDFETLHPDGVSIQASWRWEMEWRNADLVDCP